MQNVASDKMEPSLITHWQSSFNAFLHTHYIINEQNLTQHLDFPRLTTMRYVSSQWPLPK